MTQIGGSEEPDYIEWRQHRREYRCPPIDLPEIDPVRRLRAILRTTVALLLRPALVALLVLILTGLGALYAAVPYIEREMSFHPEKYDPKRPWRYPAGAEDVFFNTEDGVHLYGWFLTGSTPKNGIAVLLFHGNGGNVAGVSHDAAFFQQRGFDVLAIDYRGYGKSEGESLNEATLQRDGRAALKYLTDARGLDPANIALVGQSLGTIVATDLAITSPCRALVLLAPLASAHRQALGVFPWLPDFFFDRMANRFDTVGKISRAQCPVLVVHSDQDSTIPFDHGLAVYEAARQPKRMIVVPGDWHVLSVVDGRSYTNDVVAFMLRK